MSAASRMRLSTVIAVLAAASARSSATRAATLSFLSNRDALASRAPTVLRRYPERAYASPCDRPIASSCAKRSWRKLANGDLNCEVICCSKYINFNYHSIIWQRAALNQSEPMESCHLPSRPDKRIQRDRIAGGQHIGFWFLGQ